LQGGVYSDVINVAPYAFGGFVTVGTVDAVDINFVVQGEKMSEPTDWILRGADGTALEVAQAADGAYELPAALFGHPYFRFKLASGTAAAQRIILVSLSN
jgi:hypothetical protein